MEKIVEEKALWLDRVLYDKCKFFTSEDRDINACGGPKVVYEIGSLCVFSSGEVHFDYPYNCNFFTLFSINLILLA
jgi:hypothetical protein